MASTYTQNLLLENPTPADPATNNTWGTTENTGRTLTDSAVAGILTLSVAGAANVTLTSTQGAADQARNAHFVFTGVLTGNIIVLYPASKSRVFSIFNNTTGAFTLAAGASNGGGAAAGSTTNVPQGGVMDLVSDGTNVAPRVTALSTGLLTTLIAAATTAALPPAGVMFDYAGTVVPSGYLICDGSTQLRATYPALFAVLGTIYGAGDGSTNFVLPDLRGRVRAGVDNMGGSTAGRITNAIAGIVGTTLGATGGSQSQQSHTHTVNDGGHHHGSPDGFGFMTTPGSFGLAAGVGTSTQSNGSNTTDNATGITNAATGAGNSQNVQPAIMLNVIIKT